MLSSGHLNVLMETKGGKKSSSSSSKSQFYEAPLGYSIEDVRPNGGIKKFRSAAYSNVSFMLPILLMQPITIYFFSCEKFPYVDTYAVFSYVSMQCARKPS